MQLDWPKISKNGIVLCSCSALLLISCANPSATPDGSDREIASTFEWNPNFESIRQMEQGDASLPENRLAIQKCKEALGKELIGSKLSHMYQAKNSQTQYYYFERPYENDAFEYVVAWDVSLKQVAHIFVGPP